MVSDIIDKLHKLRYFEGYPEWAVEKAVKQFRKNYLAGVSGPHSQLFQRFPGLALRVLEIDGELDGPEDLKLVTRQLAKSTFKLLELSSLKVKREAETILLQFHCGDTPYNFRMGCEGWIPASFYSFFHSVMKEQCNGIDFQSIPYPDPGQCDVFVLCTKRSFRVLMKAKLIPTSHDLDQSSTTKAKSARAAVVPSKAKAEKTKTFPMPSNLLRAERLKLVKNGKWKIPSLSVKTIANRRNAPTAKHLAMSNTINGSQYAMGSTLSVRFISV